MKIHICAHEHKCNYTSDVIQNYGIYVHAKGKTKQNIAVNSRDRKYYIMLFVRIMFMYLLQLFII